MTSAKTALVATVLTVAFGLALGLPVAPAEAHGDSTNCLHNDPNHKHCLPPDDDPGGGETPGGGGGETVDCSALGTDPNDCDCQFTKRTLARDVGPLIEFEMMQSCSTSAPLVLTIEEGTRGTRLSGKRNTLTVNSGFSDAGGQGAVITNDPASSRSEDEPVVEIGITELEIELNISLPCNSTGDPAQGPAVVSVSGIRDGVGISNLASATIKVTIDDFDNSGHSACVGVMLHDVGPRSLITETLILPTIIDSTIYQGTYDEAGILVMDSDDAAVANSRVEQSSAGGAVAIEYDNVNKNGGTVGGMNNNKIVGGADDNGIRMWASPNTIIESNSLNADGGAVGIECDVLVDAFERNRIKGYVISDQGCR